LQEKKINSIKRVARKGDWPGAAEKLWGKTILQKGSNASTKKKGKNH